MAAKVGGIYVSLALNTAEFSGGVEKSVAQMRAFDKEQAAMAKAVDRVSGKLGQQAVIVGQLALQNVRMGPTISLVAMHAQQYYQAMERAAAGSANFSRSGAAMAATLKSLSANWIALTVQVAKIGIDMILEEQLKKAQKVAADARAAAERVERDTVKARAAWERDLQDQFNAAIGKQKELTIAEIAEEARRTKNYEEGRKRAEKLIAEARYKYDQERRRKWEEEEAAHTARVQKEYEDQRKRVTAEFDAFDADMERMKAEAQAKELSGAKAILQALRDKYDLARRYADLVTGRGQGTAASRLASMEALGMVRGVPGQAASDRVFNAENPGVRGIDSTEMERLLRIIAEAAQKELAIA